MSMASNITAYILCGGASKRMQEEKGLVLYKGQPFVKHVIDALHPITSNIYLVTSNEAYRQFGLELLPDIYSNKGPVGGIYTALKHSSTANNLILSCDIPEVSTEVISKYIIANLSEADVTYVSNGTDNFPLIAAYSKTCLPIFEKALVQDNLKLRSAIEQLNCNRVIVEEEDQLALRNINTKEELQTLINETQDTMGTKLQIMETNELYPIFVKVHQLDVLIVGGGNVGLEKLSFMLKSSPRAKVEVVSKTFHEDLVALASKHPTVKLTQKAYDISDLENRHLVIGCTDNLEVNLQINKDAKSKQLLVNIADTPDQCDFYLGGIVTKGNVKIAISTNGKSPTTAKRIRQFLEDVIPEDINQLVNNLNAYRKTIKGDFEEKVKQMNQITSGLVNKKE